MTTIGFIGLGIMGSRMARNLQKAGFELVVHNRTQEKAVDLLEDGATWANSPADVGQQADTVITMLAHPEAVEAVATELLPAMREGSLWMDCSTVHPRFSRQMAAKAEGHGVRFIDSPVGGTKQPAEQGKLLFIMGGAEDDINEVLPLVEVMGARHIHVGGHGMGSSMKVVVNHMLAVSMAGFAEGAVLAEAMGIPQEEVFGLLIGSAVTAPFVAAKQGKMESGDYDTDFALRWLRKDLRMAAEAATDCGIEMAVSQQTGDLFQQAVDAGYGDDDFAAVYTYLKEQS